jgi:regulator of ribonuclease activity A
MKPSPTAATESAEKFSTCDLCDAHKNSPQSQFRVLAPVFQNYGGLAAFCGPVRTVKCFEDNSLVKTALDESGWIATPQGPVRSVLVVDGGASLRRALVGGNLGAAAVQNGWAGLVVDGCVRDAAELAVLPLGVRALALMPLPTDKRNQGERDLAVQIQGVWVAPGEWLYADADGMVVSAVRLLG